jgi:flavin-dependent dehydrogenase
VGKALRELYDIAVVGGGPAAAAAALRASRRGASVLVVAKEKLPRAQICAGWLGPAGVALCKECGLSAKKARVTEFKGMWLHSWDLKRGTSVDDPELRGWLVNRATFDHALLREATGAGADVLHRVTVQDLHLGEDSVVLRLSDGRDVAGQVVLIADGVASPTGRMVNLTAAAQQPDMPYCALAEYQAREKAVRLDAAIGASGVGQLATIVRFGHTVRVAVVTRAAEVSIEQQFRAFCDNGVKCGLLPAGVPDRPTRELCPSGGALDMETHVGKRCLLIGEAGGFVAAFSNEAIYPAMCSGWIAADTALRALQAPVLQDELASFGLAWRRGLADYLRMPNTDLSLLVPLVFNNEQMSRRVARAFLLGQPF